MKALHYLKFSYNLDNEAVVQVRIENPYWHWMKYFGRKLLSFDPSRVTCLRTGICDAGVDDLLKKTIKSGGLQGR